MDVVEAQGCAERVVRVGRAVCSVPQETPESIERNSAAGRLRTQAASLVARAVTKAQWRISCGYTSPCLPLTGSLPSFSAADLASDDRGVSCVEVTTTPSTTTSAPEECKLQ